MAQMPNSMTVTVTQSPMAAELETLALQHEEFANLCRAQADRLRHGFELTLQLQATQVMHKPEEDLIATKSEPEPTEGCLVCGNKGGANFTCDHPDAHIPLETESQDANGEPKPRQTAEDIFAAFDPERLVGRTINVNLKPLEPQESLASTQWRKGTHFLPWGSTHTTCGVDTRGLRMSWDSIKGDWVHPVRPGVMKARTTAHLKYVDCPDCREKIHETFTDSRDDIEWLRDFNQPDEVEDYEMTKEEEEE